MTVAYADFVAVFTEFSDSQKFPQVGIDFWIGQAPTQLNLPLFGQQADLATMLYVAHNLVLSAQNARAAQRGIPGAQISPVQSKTIGEISVAYDTKATTIEGAGAWNATSYGQRLYTMMKAVGIGPLYRVPPRTVAAW